MSHRGRLYPQIIEQYASVDFGVRFFAPVQHGMSFLTCQFNADSLTGPYFSADGSYDRATADITWTFGPVVVGATIFTWTMLQHAADILAGRFYKWDIVANGTQHLVFSAPILQFEHGGPGPLGFRSGTPAISDAGWVNFIHWNWGGRRYYGPW